MPDAKNNGDCVTHLTWICTKNWELRSASWPIGQKCQLCQHCTFAALIARGSSQHCWLHCCLLLQSHRISVVAFPTGLCILSMIMLVVPCKIHPLPSPIHFQVHLTWHWSDAIAAERAASLRALFGGDPPATAVGWESSHLQKVQQKQYQAVSRQRALHQIRNQICSGRRSRKFSDIKISPM